jgi:von Willebrand factor A domain-containing protein 8
VHIIHPHRYAQLETLNSDKKFIPAHKNFRVIAIGAPVPPYPGYPSDPPFRSRFQARFCDPVGSLLALSSRIINKVPSSISSIPFKIRDIILSSQYASESHDSLEAVSKPALPAFPQTALVKLYSLIALFPPPSNPSPGQLA